MNGSDLEDSWYNPSPFVSGKRIFHKLYYMSISALHNDPLN